MDTLGTYLFIGAVVAAVLVYFVVKIVRFCKLSKDDKKKILLTYLAGIVAMVENEIGSGHGAEKLEEVENYFKKHAGVFYKLILQILGKESLKDLIEEALTMIKDGFEK